jgi:dihydrofolate reductase
MRTLLYGAAMSLDGYIARGDGAVDLLRWSDDIAQITASYWETIDCVVMGRKTYEVAGSPVSTPYPGKQVFVYSRRLAPHRGEGLEIVEGDAAEHVRALKAGGGAGICLMGGGELARSLFDAGLIDEVGANVHPILLGSGIAMFPPAEREVPLELVESRPIAEGCVYVLYRVVHGRRAGQPLKREGEP